MTTQALLRSARRLVRLAAKKVLDADKTLRKAHKRMVEASRRRPTTRIRRGWALHPPPADRIEVEHGLAGRYTVDIVSGQETARFRLPPRLGEFLQFTVSGDYDMDGLVGFRTLRDAAEHLNATVKTIRTLKWRVRIRLQRKGINPNLIEMVGVKRDAKLRFRTRKAVTLAKQPSTAVPPRGGRRPR